LSEAVGIDLSRLGNIFEEAGDIKTGGLLQFMEYKNVKSGSRPGDLRIYRSGLGQETLSKAFIDSSLEPGYAYPSRAFQLQSALQKTEKELLPFNLKDTIIEPIGQKGIRQKIFGFPQAITTRGKEYAGVYFYKLTTKKELENLGFFAKKQKQFSSFVTKQRLQSARKSASQALDYGLSRPIITPGRLVGLGSVGRAFDYRMPRQTYKTPRYDFRVPKEFRQTTPRYSEPSYGGLPRMPRQKEVSFRDFGYTPTREPTYRPPRESTYRDVPYYPTMRTPTYRPPRTPTLRTPPMTPPTRPPTKRGKQEEARIDYASGTFNAFVRRNNNTKWVKATKKPLPYNAAFNQGLSVADNTVARSVKLKRASKTYSGLDDPFIAEQKFRRRKQRSKIPGEETIFVEQSKFALDTLGEKKGIKSSKFYNKLMFM